MGSSVTDDHYLPSIKELTVEELPLGTPAIRAGAFHYGIACEYQNHVSTQSHTQMSQINLGAQWA